MKPDNRFSCPEEEIAFLRAYVKVLRKEKGENESLILELQHSVSELKEDLINVDRLSKKDRNIIKASEIYREQLRNIQQLRKQNRSLKIEKDALIMKLNEKSK